MPPSSCINCRSWGVQGGLHRIRTAVKFWNAPVSSPIWAEADLGRRQLSDSSVWARAVCISDWDSSRQSASTRNTGCTRDRPRATGHQARMMHAFWRMATVWLTPPGAASNPEWSPRRMSSASIDTDDLRDH